MERRGPTPEQLREDELTVADRMRAVNDKIIWDDEQLTIICQILEKYGFSSDVALKETRAIIAGATVYPGNDQVRWKLPSNIGYVRYASWEHILALHGAPVHSIHDSDS